MIWYEPSPQEEYVGFLSWSKFCVIHSCSQILVTLFPPPTFSLGFECDSIPQTFPSLEASTPYGASIPGSNVHACQYLEFWQSLGTFLTLA